MRQKHVRAILGTGFAILCIASPLCFTGCQEGATQSPSNINPTPTITTISPNTAIASGAAFTLMINGMGFITASTVNFGGMAQATTYVSTTQLTATIPAAAIAFAETAVVTVSNPAPGGGSSNDVNFTVAVNIVPAITGLVPSSIAAGGSAFTLTVSGSNIGGGSVVEWNGSARPTTVSFGSATAQISASDIAQTGTAAITVFNPAPGAGTSKAVNFTIGVNPVPTADFFGPSCAPDGAQGFTLSVNGSNFLPRSVVMWNGNARPTTVADSFDLTAQISASDIAEAGTSAVTVFNPPPGGGSSSTFNFTTAAGASPQLIAVDPTGKFAYVADQGCPDTFTGRVSVFTIDPSTGALSSAGTPVDTGDFSTNSVAVDPSGKFVYVANEGTGDIGDTAGSVSMYAINAATGALTSIGTPVASGDFGPSSVAVDPTGKFAYVANTGSDAVGAPLFCGSVTTFDIDGSTGSLTSSGIIFAPGAPIPGSCSPSWVAVDPTGKFAYVANEGGFTPTSVSMYQINAMNGALAFTGVIAVTGRAVSLTLAPSGKFAYVADGGQNSDGSPGDNVSIYSVDGSTGALSSIGTIAAGLFPWSIAIDPLGKFAYVANLGSNDISVYSINGTTGALTPIGTTDAGLSPTSIVVHPSGKFAYVTNSGSNNISMYNINSTTGALTLIGTIGT
jgi:6-phosphogluconolactonase (cycloisomerase 2 family)